MQKGASPLTVTARLTFAFFIFHFAFFPPLRDLRVSVVILAFSSS